MQFLTTVTLAAAVGILPASCRSEGTPTQPTAANYAGTWSGQYHVVGCSRLSGPGPSVCDAFLAPPGASWPLRLTLSQVGAAVSGALELFDNTGTLVVERGDVSGTIDSSGALTLVGITKTTDASEPSQSTLSDWNSVMVEDGRTMTGRFTRNQAFQNFWGGQQITMDCELVNFRRAGS